MPYISNETFSWWLSIQCIVCYFIRKTCKRQAILLHTWFHLDETPFSLFTIPCCIIKNISMVPYLMRMKLPLGVGTDLKHIHRTVPFIVLISLLQIAFVYKWKWEARRKQGSSHSIISTEHDMLKVWILWQNSCNLKTEEKEDKKSCIYLNRVGSCTTNNNKT
jgi:hypothetical protein